MPDLLIASSPAEQPDRKMVEWPESALAAQLVKFHRVPGLGGRISFSTKLHTVFGRDYRVIEIQNNKASFKGLVRAKVIPKL